MAAKLMLIAAVILAAGGSRRLGSPKPLLPLGDQTLLAQTLQVVSATKNISKVFVVLGAHHDQTRAAVHPQQAEVVLNPDWPRGLSSSLQAGLAAALAWKPDLDSVLFTLVDQPYLSTAALNQIVDRALQSPPETQLVAARYENHPGAPCWARAALFKEITHLSGDQGLRPLFARLTPRELLQVPLPELATDIDTPEDYQKFLDREQ